MKIHELKNVLGLGHTNPVVRNLRCPHCGKIGAFHGLGGLNDASWSIRTVNAAGHPLDKVNFRAGVRLCPNTDCNSIVLISFNAHENSNLVYPFELVEFDPIGIPEEIIKSFKEALLCHGAGCYRASALMVRR